MIANKDKLLDHLVQLQLRPVSSELNRIRYWSALDDPREEKWDNNSHISRMERKYPQYERPAFHDDETQDVPSSSKPKFLIFTAVLVLVVLLGVSGYFLWTEFLSPTLQSRNQGGYAPISAYMLSLGNREIGIVAQEDRAKVESYMQALTQQAVQQAGTDVIPKQSLRFDAMTVDAIYVPSISDVTAIIARHTVFTPVDMQNASAQAVSTQPESGQPESGQTGSEQPVTNETEAEGSTPESENPPADGEGASTPESAQTATEKTTSKRSGVEIDN